MNRRVVVQSFMYNIPSTNVRIGAAHRDAD